MGKSAQKAGTIVIVAAVAVAAFVAGRMSSTSRPFGGDALERACLEGNALEYREKIKAEFRQAQQDWEARHNRYQWPVHAAVYRSFERPDVEGYLERAAPTRADYRAYTERRIECARQVARR